VQEKNPEGLIDFCNNGKTLMSKDFVNRKQSFVCSINKDGSDPFEINLGQLVIALILIKSRFLLARPVEMRDILICGPDDNVASAVKKYFSETIEESIEDDTVDIDDLKSIIAYSLEEFADLTFEINQSAGNSVNIYDMLKLSEKNKRVADLLAFKVDENQGYFETVDSIKTATRDLLEEISRDTNNCYRNLILAISVGQFQQVFCNIGYKPEIISSAIYPHCVNTNLYQGMRNEMDYFVSAMGARKALITNALQVRRAGYTSRKLLLLVLNQKLSDVEDCGSEDYVMMQIETKDSLKRLHGRFHYTKKGLKTLSKHGMEMIGKHIKLRSPATCHLGNGEICRTCYGQLHRVNPFHIGIAGVLNLTEQLTQMLLSSKHLLQINPEKIELPPGLEEYFYIDKTSLIAKRNFRVNVQNIQKTGDEEELSSNKIIVLDDDRQIEFDFEEGKEIFLDLVQDKISTYRSDNILDIYEDNEVFRINIENTELITPLKKIIKLLESEALLNEYSIHLLLPEFLSLLEKSNIRSSSVTIELILRELIRDANNIQERPKNFADVENIKFLKLTNALVNHPSAAITLAFERMDQVVENNLFQKNQSSIIDLLY
jgi:hypothetical protein